MSAHAEAAPVASRGGRSRVERLQRIGAAAATLLLHALLLLLALTAEPLKPSDPAGAAAGGRLDVTFIDAPQAIPSPPPPSPQRSARRPVEPDPAERPDPSRLQVVEVDRADAPLPQPRRPRPETAAPPAPPAPQRPHPSQQAWGQPPGTQAAQHAVVDAGSAPSPSISRGSRPQGTASGAALEAGGFQVVYDLMAETRLRAWRDAGMTEVFLPLPGVRQLMVCPLETALRRDSGPCRLVEPDDPELAGIGDAREVIAMYQVYRRGKPVWSGPGPYR